MSFVFLTLLMKAILHFMQKKFEDYMPVIIEENKAGLKVKLAFIRVFSNFQTVVKPKNFPKSGVGLGLCVLLQPMIEDIPSPGTTTTSASDSCKGFSEGQV